MIGYDYYIVIPYYRDIVPVDDKCLEDDFFEDYLAVITGSGLHIWRTIHRVSYDDTGKYKIEVLEDLGWNECGYEIFTNDFKTKRVNYEDIVSKIMIKELKK